MTPESLWSERQYHPELVVRDAAEAFSLSPKQSEELRKILMRRGVNKALLLRRRFIAIKHEVKDLLKASEPRTELFLLLQRLNEKMQRAAKMSRWVEWGRVPHHNMRKNEEEVVVLGRRC